MKNVFVFEPLLLVVDEDKNFIYHNQCPINMEIAVVADTEENGMEIAQIKIQAEYPIPELKTKKTFFKKTPYYRNCLDKTLKNPVSVQYIMLLKHRTTADNIIADKLKDMFSADEIKEILK